MSDGVVRFFYAMGLVAGTWSVWIEGAGRSDWHTVAHLTAITVCLWGLTSKGARDA